MDALTHAVESYIGKHLGTPRTREQAAQAVGLTAVGVIRTGAAADLVVLDEKLDIQAVYVDGEKQ